MDTIQRLSMDYPGIFILLAPLSRTSWEDVKNFSRNHQREAQQHDRSKCRHQVKIQGKNAQLTATRG